MASFQNFRMHIAKVIRYKSEMVPSVTQLKMFLHFQYWFLRPSLRKINLEHHVAWWTSTNISNFLPPSPSSFYPEDDGS
jgi:hypothetical protein